VDPVPLVAREEVVGQQEEEEEEEREEGQREGGQQEEEEEEEEDPQDHRAAAADGQLEDHRRAHQQADHPEVVEHQLEAPGVAVVDSARARARAKGRSRCGSRRTGRERALSPITKASTANGCPGFGGGKRRKKGGPPPSQGLIPGSIGAL